MSLSQDDGASAMVDVKYRKLYNQPIQYRAMTTDKWLYAEKYNTVQDVMDSCMDMLVEDFFIVETFPGYKKFPVYNDNVK